MLAANNKADEVLARVTFPVLASPKLDGVRGFNRDGVIMSRNILPLPNTNLQETFGWSRYFGYDGEFVLGTPTDRGVFNRTYSVVSSHNKPIAGLSWYVFDYIDCSPDIPFDKRIEQVRGDNLVVVLPQTLIRDMEHLLWFEDWCLQQGYEGLILRDPHGRYKYGRSTLREGLLVKLKRLEDSEAVVIGFEERMHNANEKTLVRNEKATRSSHQSGLVGRGDLGAIRVRWIATCGDSVGNAVEFNIGTGFTDAERAEIWANQHLYLGRTCVFKYMPYGMKDAPRQPTFKGWRDGGL